MPLWIAHLYWYWEHCVLLTILTALCGSNALASHATIPWPGCYSGNAIYSNNDMYYFAII